MYEIQGSGGSTNPKLLIKKSSSLPDNFAKGWRYNPLTNFLLYSTSVNPPLSSLGVKGGTSTLSARKKHKLKYERLESTDSETDHL